MAHRVSIVLDCLELGGAERQALLLASSLHVDPNYEVEVIGLGTDGKASNILSEQGIPHSHLELQVGYGKMQMLRNTLKVRKALKRFKPTAVIPYTYWPNVLAGLAWKSAGANVGLWNQRDEGRNMFKTYFEKRALSSATFIVSNSYEGRDFLVEEMAIPTDSINVVNNGVRLAEAKKSKDQWLNELGLNAEHKTAVMVANLHRFKDHKTLVSAWQQVVKVCGEHCILLLAGRFKGTEEEIKQQAQELGIQEQVRLLGGIDDIAGLLNSADVLVHSSKKEGCPNGVLEGMLAHRPVVATNISGCQQALGEEYPYLSATDNADEMAKHLIALFTDEVAAAKVAKGNHQRVTSEFSPEGMVEAYKTMIESRG